MIKNLKEKDNSNKSLFLWLNKYSLNNQLKLGGKSSNESKHSLWKSFWTHPHKSEAVPCLLSGELKQFHNDAQKATSQTVRS